MSIEGSLGPKKLRQASRVVGEPVVLGFAVQHPRVVLVTGDDKHYEWNRNTGAVVMEEEPTHYTTCPSRATKLGAS